jgi:TolB protein
MKLWFRRRLVFASCCFSLLLAVALFLHGANAQSSPIGVFDGQSDVGSVTPPGTAAFDSATGAYTLTSAGANLWGTTDAFHFLWKKMSGDVTLTADIDFPAASGEHNPHRKAILILRRTLDAGSVYADAALHGAGLTALQYRRADGGITEGLELNGTAPARLRIEKRGDTITMYLGSPGAPLHPVGASTQLHLAEPFYIGLGLCSHDPSRTEKAVFSHVTLETPVLYSALNTIGDDADFRRDFIVTSTRGRFEAPNWTRDGKTLIFNQDGKIMTVSADGGTPQPLNIGDATHCNGSHGLVALTASCWRSAAACRISRDPASTLCPSPGARRASSRSTRILTGIAGRRTARRSSSRGRIMAPATFSRFRSMVAKSTR